MSTAMPAAKHGAQVAPHGQVVRGASGGVCVPGAQGAQCRAQGLTCL